MLSGILEAMHDFWIDNWLGTARFQRYIDECNGDRVRALDLYEWNVKAGQAIMRDISHFEVALRNKYDATIKAAWPYGGHWLLPSESPAVMPIWRTKIVKGIKRGSDVNYLNRKNVDDAIRRSSYGEATPGKVIAELSFGFWRQFTTNAMEKSLWVPYLHKAFPAGTNCKQVDTKIENINKLRNRIAHHEPLITQKLDPKFVHQELMECLGLISDEVHRYVLDSSQVDQVFLEKP